MRLRQAAATWAGKMAQQLSRRLGAGGGTTLPGLVARWVAPMVLRDVVRELRDGVILVTGTNGKTTTARMLAAMFAVDGRRIIHNRAGANLISGLTSTAVAHTDMWGHPRADLALFETDEAHVPDAIRETQPRVVLVLNLFRDQLDRYGEVDAIAQRWRTAFRTLPAASTVVLNADDPAVAGLGEGLTCNVVYYGVQDIAHGVGAARHTADSAFCGRCGTPLDYAPNFYGHIGHWHCPACGNARPTPTVALQRLVLAGTDASHLTIQEPSGSFELTLPVPGLYNAINATAAVATALQCGLAPPLLRQALEGFAAAFGRIERFRAGERDLFMALIKNPVGASETVRMLVSTTTDVAVGLHVLIIINDKIADGTDVSWLWDADWEQLGPHVAHAVVSGTRAQDMAVRLKYAGVATTAITTHADIPTALEHALAGTPAAQTLYLLPTYTAMLELRGELARRGLVKPFWED